MIYNFIIVVIVFYLFICCTLGFILIAVHILLWIDGICKRRNYKKMLAP